MTTANANFTVTVKAGAQALSISPNGGNLPGEQQGVADAGDPVATISGGTPDTTPGNLPYKVSVSAGSLPPGMGLTNEINPDGSMSVFIEGTPTQSGAFSFTLTAQDAAGATATQRSAVPSTPAAS